MSPKRRRPISAPQAITESSVAGRIGPGFHVDRARQVVEMDHLFDDPRPQVVVEPHHLAGEHRQLAVVGQSRQAPRKVADRVVEVGATRATPRAATAAPRSRMDA